MNHRSSHILHVWMNQRNQASLGKDTREDHLYDTMSAFDAIGYFPSVLKKAWTHSLPQLHQQCSHCAPEKIENNCAMCYLGKDVTKCEILQSVKALWDEYRAEPKSDEPREKIRSYYREAPEDDLYEMMGWVCAWHMLMSCHGDWKAASMPPASFIDWNEGAIQDKSDRMFWERVYENMATDPGDGEPEETETKETA